MITWPRPKYILSYPVLSDHPVLSGQQLIPQGWSLNTGSTVLPVIPACSVNQTYSLMARSTAPTAHAVIKNGALCIC